MAADHKRSQRLGQLIQHELAKLLVNDVKDPRVGFATVTEVRTAADLAQARAFVSILGDDAQRSETMKGLDKARGFLRRELAQRLRLRQVPELVFELDDTLDRAERLDSVFRAIQEGKSEPEPEVKPAVAPDTIRTDLARAEEHALSDAKPKAHRPRRRGHRRR